MDNADVLVVGAGPTGLTLAAAVTARTLEVLEDLDVSERLTKQGIHAQRSSIRDRDRVLMPLDFGVLPTKYPYTLMIS